MVALEQAAGTNSSRRRRGATHSQASVHKLRLAKVQAEQEHGDDFWIDRLNFYQLVVGVLSIFFWVIEVGFFSRGCSSDCFSSVCSRCQRLSQWAGDTL